MKLKHIATFMIMGAALFVSMIYFMSDQYHLAAAYFTAACSWFVVAGYEYNERVFDRAIAQLLQKYTVDKDDNI